MDPCFNSGCLSATIGTVLCKCLLFHCIDRYASRTGRFNLEKTGFPLDICFNNVINLFIIVVYNSERNILRIIQRTQSILNCL
jgi:hypothetical protein